MKILILFVFAGLALNPRIAIDSGKPDHVISCSTGWSLRWGKGLIGVYSLDSAAQLMSSSNSEKTGGSKGGSRPIDYQVARDNILRACK